MRVILFNEAETYEPHKDWKRVSLCSEAEISVEHFVKPAGHASPDPSHPNAQVLIVIEGRLTVSTGSGEEADLQPGDAVFIPGNERHVVTNPLDRPSTAIDIFVPGRSFDFWKKRAQP